LALLRKTEAGQAEKSGCSGGLLLVGFSARLSFRDLAYAMSIDGHEFVIIHDELKMSLELS
jgi:hypothetical protein